MKTEEPHKTMVNEHLKSIDALLKLFVNKKDDRAWAQEEILHGGPPHKQVLSALLLSKVYELIKQTEKQTGETFVPLTGTPVMNDKYEEKYIMPVDAVLPDKVMNKEEIAAAISKAPDHELLVYLMALQAMDWAVRKAQ